MQLQYLKKMEKINYENKVATQEAQTGTPERYFRAVDANEIKAKFGAVVDFITNNVGPDNKALTGLNTTNKTSLLDAINEVFAVAANKIATSDIDSISKLNDIIGADLLVVGNNQEGQSAYQIFDGIFEVNHGGYASFLSHNGGAFEFQSDWGAYRKRIYFDDGASQALNLEIRTKGAGSTVIMSLIVDNEGIRYGVAPTQLNALNIPSVGYVDGKILEVESKFKGTFATIEALELAWPDPDAGWRAEVDAGPGEDVKIYIGDADEGWVLQSGTSETIESVKTKYESNPDTNAFTDSEKTNLASVATKMVLVEKVTFTTEVSPRQAAVNDATINKVVKMSGFYDVPAEADVTFQVGAIITLRATGGEIEVRKLSGVSFATQSDINNQYIVKQDTYVQLVYAGDDVWDVIGNDLTALDEIAPTVVSATVLEASPNTLNILMSETVETSTHLGWLLSGHTFSAVSGSGTDTLQLTIDGDRVYSTEDLTLDYDSSVGDVADAAGNDMASIDPDITVDNQTTTSQVTQTVNVGFGPNFQTNVADWNQATIENGTLVGVIIADLLDDVGASTGIDLNLDSFDAIQAQNNGNDTQQGPLFPLNIVKFSTVFLNNGTISFGLPDGNYEFEIICSSETNSGSKVAAYDLNGATGTLNAETGVDSLGNYTNTLVLEVTIAGNRAVLDVTRGAGANAAIINGLQIRKIG